MSGTGVSGRQVSGTDGCVRQMGVSDRRVCQPDLVDETDAGVIPVGAGVTERTHD